MRLRLDGLTDDAIRRADFVTAVDPCNPELREQLFGRGWFGRADKSQKLEPGEPYAIQSLDIEIDSSNPAHLAEAENRVRSVKGGRLARKMVGTLAE